MLGFLGIFGRSQELRRIDQALRGADLHPRLVPEAVKLSMLRLLQEHALGSPDQGICERAAELVANCMLGRETFVEANGPELADDVEARLDLAVAAGRSLDARLVLLLIYARAIQPAVVERFGLEPD